MQSLGSSYFCELLTLRYSKDYLNLLCKFCLFFLILIFSISSSEFWATLDLQDRRDLPNLYASIVTSESDLIPKKS